jgi:hypothetical protein
VNLCVFYFYKLTGKLTVFFVTSGVQFEQSTSDQFHYRRTAFSSQLKSKVDNILVRLQHYGLTQISTVSLCLQDHTLTHHSHKPLVY